MSKTHLTEQKFSDFALHPAVIEALEKKGFHNCTPIQALALPLTLEEVFLYEMEVKGYDANVIFH